MADRVLLSYLEERNDEGPYWRLEVQRSSAGRPGGIVTISFESVDGTLPGTEMSVVMDDLRRLQPAIDWAEGGEMVDRMAADIRLVDGAHNLGAGALAERLHQAGWRKR